MRKMKWSSAGHINRLKDDRRTLRVTTWRPRDKKRRQGRPAKRWKDDLDKYWSDTIWQTAQDRLTWSRHAEAFAQHGALRLPNDDDAEAFAQHGALRLPNDDHAEAFAQHGALRLPNDDDAEAFAQHGALRLPNDDDAEAFA